MKYKSKLSIYKVKKIIKFFCTDIDATKTAILLELNRNTINRWYNIFRQEIYDYQVNQKRLLYGEIELDGSYFGDIRKGKRGRGAGGKTAVFGLLKRNGKVYTVVVKNTKQTTLMPIITSKSLTALFILTAIEVIMLLMSVILSTLELIIQKSLQIKATS